MGPDIRSPTGLDLRLSPLAAHFESAYGRAPHWIVRAPGRVNLIGEFTDYNGGCVLPMAIERYTEITAAPNGAQHVNLKSRARPGDVVHIDLAQPIRGEPTGRWSNYPKGVLAGFLRTGRTLGGFDAWIDTTVPIGSGLSSSAALEVAFATLLEAVCGEPLDPLEKAVLCLQAEHEYAHVPCGLMDQFTCTFAREGHAVLLDCHTREAEWIEFDDRRVSVLVVQTHVKHQHAAGQYGLRRRQCESAAGILGVSALCEASSAQLGSAKRHMDQTVFRRARHVLSEHDRTRRAALALQERAWGGRGQLMYASHESLRDDFEVSCIELDTVVEIARSLGLRNGVYGCRMTGGGFGGCAVALVESRARETIAEVIRTEYAARLGVEPGVFSSRPACGAMRVK